MKADPRFKNLPNAVAPLIAPAGHPQKTKDSNVMGKSASTRRFSKARR
jgi:hypothetical protein